MEPSLNVSASISSLHNPILKKGKELKVEVSFIQLLEDKITQALLKIEGCVSKVTESKSSS